MKKFIESLELRLSDLFLLIGFLGFVVFLIFGQEFMQYQNPNMVGLPIWAAGVAFVIMVSFWAIYLYMEIVVKKEKVNPVIIGCFAFFAILNVITIWVQPSLSVVDVIARMEYEVSPGNIIAQGTRFTIVEQISGVHKFVFSAEVIGIAMFLYIGLFIFPKRIKNIRFIEYLGYLLFALIGVLFVYSLIVEHNQYIGVFKYLLGVDRSIPLSEMSVKSFILHKNAFGMVYMLGIIFTFINQAIKARKWYYPLTGIFFVLMLFTQCKTGILLSALIILAWLVYRLVVTYKDNKKRNLITFIVLGSVIVLGGIFIGVPYLTKGKVLGKVYALITEITGSGKTVETRTFIWDNVYQLIGNGNWVIGRGFGVINLLLMPMNIKTHNDPVFPTHSSWLNMLSEGGIFLLFAYIAFLIYVGYICFKAYKKSPLLTFAIFLGAFSFFAYSFIETIHYLMYVFLFPIFVIYYNGDKKAEVKEERDIEAVPQE